MVAAYAQRVKRQASGALPLLYVDCISLVSLPCVQPGRITAQHNLLIVSSRIKMREVRPPLANAAWAKHQLTVNQ